MQIRVVHSAFSIIRNCLNKGILVAEVPKSRFLIDIFSLMYRFNLLSGFKIVGNKIFVFLKYFNGVPVIKDLRVFYSVGKPVYFSSLEIARFRGRYNFYSFALYTSSFGIIEDSFNIISGANSGGKLVILIEL